MRRKVRNAHPKSGDGRKREDRDAGLVLEGETDEQHDDFGDVATEQVEQEL